MYPAQTAHWQSDLPHETRYYVNDEDFDPSLLISYAGIQLHFRSEKEMSRSWIDQGRESKNDSTSDNLSLQQATDGSIKHS